MEVFKTELAQGCGCRQNQLDLRQIGRFSQYINITLHELTVASSLRPVRTPYISYLQRLERRGQLAGVIGIKTDERNGQVITQSAVHQISLFFGCFQIQLFSPFHNFENKLFIVAALFIGKVCNILHTRGFNRGKSEFTIGILYYTDYIISQLHLSRQNILHTGYRFLA